MKRKLYVAYGANLSSENMVANRCKDSIYYGSGVVTDFELVFRGVATIEPKKDALTPVVVWEISDEDEVKLDAYEGVKYNFYRKEVALVYLYEGGIIEGMVYILNNENRPIKEPSINYLNVIMKGYNEHNLAIGYLLDALARSKQTKK